MVVTDGTLVAMNLYTCALDAEKTFLSHLAWASTAQGVDDERAQFRAPQRRHKRSVVKHDEDIIEVFARCDYAKNATEEVVRCWASEGAKSRLCIP